MGTGTGLGLLMFNLGENEGILRNARELAAEVDEIVVIDSSSPATRERLSHDLRPLGGRVVPLVPLGFGDINRSFGVAKMTSEWVFALDADEEVSPELKEVLPSLREADAYVLPRFEAELGSFTYHMRLFRRDAVRFRGRSYEFPSVDGPIGHLGRSTCIVHRAHYGRYLEEKDRHDRYFFVESVERPYFRGYLMDGLTVRIGGRAVSIPVRRLVGSDTGEPLSPPAIRLLIEFEFVRDLLLGKGLRAARFNRRYSIGKSRYLGTRSEDERAWIRQIAAEVQQAGGLIEYLGFRDPTILERLTSSFNWDRGGIEVLRELLAYRHSQGRPMQSFARNDVPNDRAKASGSAALTVSVVVPTHDRPERVTTLLRSLVDARPEALSRVIVVDDSREPADYQSQFPDLPLDHVTLGERAFISHAKNLGWRRAQSDLVYFIDDDNVVTGETFAGALAAMASDPDLGAVVPAVLYRRRPDLVWVYATPWAHGRWGHTLVGRNRPRVAALEGKLLDTDALPNASLVRRSAFEETGGFSEDLVVNSSADAAMRLKRAGWKVRAYTGAFIYHDVDPPGEFGYWAQHGVADPERVYHEVRDWFLLMRSVHLGEPWFRLRATFHALGFMLPNGTTYLVRGGARGRASFRSLVTGYLGGLRATSRQA